jgi:hypothetical protein
MAARHAGTCIVTTPNLFAEQDSAHYSFVQPMITT